MATTELRGGHEVYGNVYKWTSGILQLAHIARAVGEGIPQGTPPKTVSGI